MTGTKTNAFIAAFPHTVPILAGFAFLGITCGIYATSLGLAWWIPPLMSLVIFGGSAEFVVAALLMGAFEPITAAGLVLVIQARHIFYGLSMLETYAPLGPKRFYMIYALCDETFSINYATKVPEGVDRGWFMFFISLLDHLYWFAGCLLGGLFGRVATLDIEGVSFAMTALFVVIFLDNWKRELSHTSSLVGLVAAGACLALFGADNFMLPTLGCILACMSALYGVVRSGRTSTKEDA